MAGQDFSLKNIVQKVAEKATDLNTGPVAPASGSLPKTEISNGAIEAAKGQIPGAKTLDGFLDAKPLEAKPVESKPVESKPVESKPVEATPASAPAPQAAQQAAPAAAAQVSPPPPATAQAASQSAVASASAGVAEATQAVQSIPDKLAQAKADQLEDLISHNKIAKSEALMKELVAVGRVDLVEQAMARALGRNDTPVENGLLDRNGALDSVKKFREIAGPVLGDAGVSASLERIGQEAIYARLHEGYKSGAEDRLKGHVEKIAQFCFGVDKSAAAEAVQPIASRVVDRYRGEGFATQADRMGKEYGVENKPRAAMVNELRDIVLDPNYNADDKAALIKSFQMQKNLSRSDMRGLLDDALKGQEGAVGELPLEQAKKMQAGVKAGIDMYSEGIDFDRPGRDFESALEKRVDKLESQVAERQQAKEREAREQARVAAEKEAKEAAERRATERAALEGKVGDALLDMNLSSADKAKELKRLQAEGKLSDQQLRDIVGKELKGRAEGRAGELSLEQAKKLQDDMKVLDKEIGVLEVLWENNRFQDQLSQRVTSLERVEAQRQQAEERLAKEAERQAQQQAAKEAAAEKAAAQAKLEKQVGDVFLDLSIPPERKVLELKRLQSEGKLSDQELRNIVGKEVQNRGTGFVGSLTLEQTYKLQADMDLMDKKIGNGIFGLSENDNLERELSRRESMLEEAARRQRK